MNRDDFPILNKKINGNDLIYFDNMATSQKPYSVLNSINNFYLNSNSNVHRGVNPLSIEATNLYENSRLLVSNFISSNPSEVIFTRGSTESSNIIVRGFCEDFLNDGDTVVLSIAEHHSNIVPWLQLQKKIDFDIVYINVGVDGNIDYEQAKDILSLKSVKVFSITHCSNVLGIINDVSGLINFVKNINPSVLTIVDATASIPHVKINVKDIGCDFLYFSGHKMFGPTGIGVLYGREDILNKMSPFYGGGDMIKSVYTDKFIVNDLPYKFEAGTPDISGAIALGEACRYIDKVGYDFIKKNDNDLVSYFFERIAGLGFLKVFGFTRLNKLPIFSMTIDRIHPHDVSDILGQSGIILRSGHHCAQPLHDFYGVGSTFRVSLCFYNTKEEIDVFVSKIKELYESFTNWEKSF